MTLTHQCYGLEINADAARHAEKAGLKMLNPHELNKEDQTLMFDSVVLVDVFEHLSDPISLIKSAVRRIAPGGLLIVCTGDADAKAICGDPANFWYMRNIEHIIMMSYTYSQYMALKLGLQITTWEHISHYDSTLLQRFGQWYRSLAFDVLHRGKWSVIAPLIRFLPGGSKAAAWTERPQQSMTPDHVVAIFKRLEYNL